MHSSLEETENCIGRGSVSFQAWLGPARYPALAGVHVCDFRLPAVFAEFPSLALPVSECHLTMITDGIDVGAYQKAVERLRLAAPCQQHTY